MQRWVGLRVIADDLINVGLAISKQSAKQLLSPTLIILREPRQLALAGFIALPLIDRGSPQSWDFAPESS
jgi:hypothetical protein